MAGQRYGIDLDHGCNYPFELSISFSKKIKKISCECVSRSDHERCRPVEYMDVRVLSKGP